MEMRLRVLLLSAAFAVACGTVAAAEFTAEVVTRDSDGGSHAAKIYVSRDNVRVDLSATVYIWSLERKTCWSVYLDERVYTERPLNGRMGNGSYPIDCSQFARDLKKGYAVRTSLGTERVRGYLCRKVHYSRPLAKDCGTVWYSDDLGCPIRLLYRRKDGYWESAEYLNIKPGKPRKSVFQVPAGMRKVSRPPLPARKAAAHNGKH